MLLEQLLLKVYKTGLNRRIITKILGVLLFTAIFIPVSNSSICVASDESLDGQSGTTQYQIEELNEKVNTIVGENQSIKESAQSAIDTANIHIQAVGAIVAVAGFVAAIAGFVFTGRIRSIEESARAGAANMKITAREVELLKEAISKRKTELDDLFDDIEREISRKRKELKSKKISPKEKDRLLELENEVLKLKANLSRSMQPYIWGGPTSTPTTIAGSGAGGVIIGPAFGASSPTTTPFYPGPNDIFCNKCGKPIGKEGGITIDGNYCEECLKSRI